MPTSWSFSFLAGGAWSAPVLFPDAYIKGAERKVVNQSADSCTVNFANTRPPNVGPLASGTWIRIFRDDFDGAAGASNPVGFFTGRVVAPRRTIAGGSESSVLVLNGPWWELANIVYQQLGLFYSPVGTLTLSGDAIVNTATGPQISFGQVKVELSTAPYLQLSSDVILTQAQDEGIPMDAAETLTDALQYALDKGARFTIGTLPDTIAIPSQTGRDQTCADVVKKVLRWMPGVVAWFDYKQDPPVLNFEKRADRTPATLLLGGATPQVQQATLQARPDLIRPAITLNFLRRLSLTSTVATTTSTTPAATADNPHPQPVLSTTYPTTTGAIVPASNNSGYIATTKPPASATTTDPATGATTSTTSTESSTAVNCLEIDSAGPAEARGGIGALVATVELQGGDVNATAGAINTTPFEPTPVGLADFILAACSVLAFEGTVQAKGQELIDLGNPLSHVLNITGGDEEWLTMAAEIQSATENTATGLTNLTLGAPTQLGPSDLAALLQAARLRNFVDLGTSTLRNTGGAPLPPANPLPPPSAPPGSNGGHGGPSTAPDGGTETHDGFTGLFHTFAGSYTFHTDPDGIRADSSGFHAANTTGFGTRPGETDQGPGGGSFHASASSDATCIPGSTADVPGGPAHWSTAVTNTASHTEGNLDLTGFSALQYSYAELRGSSSSSDDTGNTHTDDYSEDVTARLGTKSFYRLYAPGYARYYHDAGGGYNAANGSSSISIDRLYLVPRKN